MKAAQAVLDLKGVPTNPSAEEARSAMEARRRDAERSIEQIIKDIKLHGVLAKPTSDDLILLKQNKVSDRVIDAMRSASVVVPQRVVYESAPPPVIVEYEYGPPPPPRYYRRPPPW